MEFYERQTQGTGSVITSYSIHYTKLYDLDANSILFRPDTASSVSELSEGDELPECSLKLADTIVNPECRVLKGGTLMRMEIVKLADGERKTWLSFIGERE